MTKDSNLFFVFQHRKTIEFKFAELIEVQMGWFYFNITFLQSVKNPLLQIKHERASVKCALLPSASKYNEICCTAVINEWLVLDKHSRFKAHSNLNLHARYPNI